MRQLTIILTTFLLTSCCCKYDDNDFAFTELHDNLLKPYAKGDTIFFVNQTGDFDTITVSNIETYKQCGCIMAGNLRHVSVEIRHLPKNNWTAGTEHSQDGSVKVLDQDLIVIEKMFKDENPDYFIGINYRTLMGEFPSFDSCSIDNRFSDLGISKYWTIKNESADWKQYKDDSTIILTAYWTEKFGLTEYELRNGDIYRIKKNVP
jgi:hypothetical protein